MLKLESPQHDLKMKKRRSSWKLNYQWNFMERTPGAICFKKEWSNLVHFVGNIIFCLLKLKEQVSNKNLHLHATYIRRVYNYSILTRRTNSRLVFNSTKQQSGVTLLVAEWNIILKISLLNTKTPLWNALTPQ